VVLTPSQRLEQAADLPAVFDVVKDCVRRHLRVERAGLMLGLSNLGGNSDHLVGGFFQVAGNMIVLNKLPLHRLQETQPAWYKPFAFHVLLHEYIHSIGYLTEAQTRPLVLDITRANFGEDHVATDMARGWAKYLPSLVYPTVGWQPEGAFELEVVRGFDPDATSYIH
jgi:hypothetical protein